ncbi:MAG: hypothetical protein AAB695_01955 [Patescibacteria group bacterium]
MKKLFIAIIILAAAAFFYYMPNISLNVKNDGASKTSQSGDFRPDPSSAVFSGVEEATVLENRAYGDLNNDGKTDVVVFLAESGGGSGVFIYAAAYVSGPINYKGSNAVFLGDRIAPQNVFIKNGIVTVSYLDRGPDEPFAAEPTFAVSKELVYRNGTLEEK